MRSRGLVLGGLVWLVALVGVLAFGGLAAQATMTHDLLSQVKEVPAGSGVPSTGRLVEPQAMTVDGGDLYVADGGLNNQNPRVDKFDASSGVFVSQFEQVPLVSFLRQGIAVGHVTGETEVYVGGDLAGTVEGAVAVFGPSGSLQKVWNGADTPEVGGVKGFGCFECGAATGDVAVDGSGSLADWAAGDVYVAAPQLGVVDVFKPEAGGGEEYVTQITEREAGVPLSGTFGVAVDPSDGDVLVVDADGVDVFEPTVLNHYAFVRRLSETRAGSPFRRVQGVAVDGGNGDIYVVDYNPRAIDQFSSAGVYLGSLTGTTAGPFNSSIQVSLAVDSSTHDVYVGDGQSNANLVDVFGPSLVVPDVTTDAVSALEPGSVTLNGTVNPDGAGAVTCQFDWGRSPSLGEVAPCSQGVPDGVAGVAVQAGLSGLAPDTTYYYRLRASNAQGTNPNGINPAEESQSQEFTTSGPGFHGESVSAVTADSATLHATIEPHNAATTYYFQYGTSSSYGADVPVAPGAGIGAGEGDVEVVQRVQGLRAGTAYHYRVVALSEVSSGHVQEFDGTDQTFTAQVVGGEGALPDGRGWELVSPPNKEGQLIYPLSEDGLVQAAADGSGIAYQASGPTEAEPQGNSNSVQVLSTRGSGGWRSLDIASANSGATGVNLGGPEFRFFSSELSLAVTQPNGPFTRSLSVEASERTAYLRTDYLGGGAGDLCVSSCLHPLVTGAAGYANVPPGTVFGGEHFYDWGPKFIGATPDLSHVVLSSNVALTRTPVPGESLYEWASGKLTLVSVLPKSEGGSPVSPAEFGLGGDAARGAISGDGSRVFWQAGGDLYMRDVVRGESVRLDAVQGGSGEGPASPRFQFASEDGSKVFFTDGKRLTSDAGALEGKPDLYECVIEMVGGALRCGLHDLTPLGAGEEPADVRGGVLGVSEDGTRVYFVADGVLAPGAVAGQCPANTGTGVAGTECNLYMSQFDGAGWGKPRLVAVLAAGDLPDWYEILGSQTARVSSDGEWLAFMSQRSLTGYDNLDAVTGRPDEEVYLYHASGGGSLVCASCDPTGARPVGVEAGKLFIGLANRDRVEWGSSTGLAANVPGWAVAYTGLPAWHQSRYLSDSGRLFFDSSDALVPQDVNGTEDVYEYEPVGVPAGSPGVCTASGVTFSEASGGCVGLISSGTSLEESVFLDASATGGRDGEGHEGGGDVFFLTAARLASQDMDTSLDIYDAHECSAASPCLPPQPAAAQPCSTGDGCKPPLASQPVIFGLPASQAFSGAGDLPAPAAAKGVVKARLLTRAQKLAAALRTCHMKKSHKKRVGCEALARRRYVAKASGRTVNARKRGGR